MIMPDRDARKLVLVRHAKSVIDRARPSSTWGLAQEAASAVEVLADRLGSLGVDGIVTSPEPKAAGTAAIIAASLGLPVIEDEAFREQGHDTTPWIADPEGFVAAVREHFAQPEEAVFGDESSETAAARFAAGVDRALAAFRFPIVVTHGRVMCGYLRDAIGVDPMDVWPHLRMPDAFLVDLDHRTLSRLNGEG